MCCLEHESYVIYLRPTNAHLVIVMLHPASQHLLKQMATFALLTIKGFTGQF